MRPSSGFYGNGTSTFFVDRLSVMWHVDTYGCGVCKGGALPRGVEALPSDVVPIHNSIIEERLWQLVSQDPRIVWEIDAGEWGRFAPGATRELSTEAASGFWDLISDDDRLF